MIKINKLKNLLLVAFFICLISGNSYGLTFSNTVTPASTTWEHTLINTDFSPDLAGNEILNINSANLKLNFTFTPTIQPYTVGPMIFNLGFATATSSLDSFYTGGTYSYFDFGTTPGNVTVDWEAPISELAALQAMSDKKAIIKLSTTVGTLVSVNSSTLSGEANILGFHEVPHTAPEPATLLLLGSGILGIIGLRKRNKKES